MKALGLFASPPSPLAHRAMEEVSAQIATPLPFAFSCFFLDPEKNRFAGKFFAGQREKKNLPPKEEKSRKGGNINAPV